MTPSQRKAIEKLNTKEKIHKQISVTHASNHPDKEAIMELLQEQLKGLDKVDDAMIEYTPLDDFGDM